MKKSSFVMCLLMRGGPVLFARGRLPEIMLGLSDIQRNADCVEKRRLAAHMISFFDRELRAVHTRRCQRYHRRLSKRFVLLLCSRWKLMFEMGEKGGFLSRSS